MKQASFKELRAQDENLQKLPRFEYAWAFLATSLLKQRVCLPLLFFQSLP